MTINHTYTDATNVRAEESLGMRLYWTYIHTYQNYHCQRYEFIWYCAVDEVEIDQQSFVVQAAVHSPHVLAPTTAGVHLVHSRTLQDVRVCGVCVCVCVCVCVGVGVCGVWDGCVCVCVGRGVCVVCVWGVCVGGCIEINSIVIIILS